MEAAHVSMTAGSARSIARDWVTANAVQLPRFLGAYTAGSINTLPGVAVIPPESDIDVMVVLDAPGTPPKPGKLCYRGILLEVTCLAWRDVRSSEQVLGHYHIAHGVRTGHILADPTGQIGRLQDAVIRDFARPEWIERRCAMARETVLARLVAIESGQSFFGRVMSWLFAAGGVPHILLVAGLRNPTVRRRYEAVHALLHEYGEDDLYPGLLSLMGARDLTPAQVSGHLDVLERVFDDAARASGAPFPFAADISADARSVAIGGSREMVARGLHREAMFWVAVTFTRCQLILHAGALTHPVTTWDGEFGALLADLGVESDADLRRGADHIREALPDMWNVARKIMQASASGYSD
jgi:hypothetical protein